MILFPGTSHEGSISSCSLALSFFACFALFLLFSRRYSSTPGSLSGLVPPNSKATTSSRFSRVSQQGRILTEGDELKGCRRGTEAGNGNGGGGQRRIGGCRCNGSGLRRSWNVRKAGRTARGDGTARGEKGKEVPSRTTQIHDVDRESGFRAHATGREVLDLGSQGGVMW